MLTSLQLPAPCAAEFIHELALLHLKIISRDILWLQWYWYIYKRRLVKHMSKETKSFPHSFVFPYLKKIKRCASCLATLCSSLLLHLPLALCSFYSQLCWFPFTDTTNSWGKGMPLAMRLSSLVALTPTFRFQINSLLGVSVMQITNDSILRSPLLQTTLFCLCLFI